MSSTCQDGDSRGNLSVSARNLSSMSNRDFKRDTTTDRDPDRASQVDALHVFDDPVAYLAVFGIVAQIVDETILPAAA